MSESEMAAKNGSKGTSLVNYCEAVLFHLRLNWPEMGGKRKGSSPSSDTGGKATSSSCR